MTKNNSFNEGKLVRAIVEKILHDDFLHADYGAIAAAFENPKFAKRLAGVVRALADDNTGRQARVETGARPSRGGSVSPDFLFDLYKRRKITKAELGKLIRDIVGFLPGSLDEVTARDMIRYVIETSTPNEIETLRARLSPTGGSDPYLKGILGR